MIRARPAATAAVLALALAPGVARAHPHVFIDAGLDFVLDGQGRLVAVDVTWVYDELYSLMLLEDQGLDADMDGVLTAEEQAKLLAQDSDWADDYEGDLYGTADGQPIPLAAPESFGVAYADGRITSTHRRPLAAPVDPAAQRVVFKTYDPWFYAAFDVTRGARVSGGACTAEVRDADLEAASARLTDQIRNAPADGIVEMDFPKVGEDFADSVILTCGAR